MTDWTEIELAALRRAYASGTTRVSYDGKSVDYGSAEDLLGRIRTIERAIAGTARPLPVAGLAGEPETVYVKAFVATPVTTKEPLYSDSFAPLTTTHDPTA